MIGLRGGGHASQNSSRVEICIAVADWARGPMTSVLGVPGGEGTGATRRKRPRDVRHRARRDPRVRRDLRDPPALRDRRDLPDLREPLRDRRGLPALPELRDRRDLPHLRGLPGLRDHKDLRDLREPLRDRRGLPDRREPLRGHRDLPDSSGLPELRTRRDLRERQDRWELRVHRDLWDLWDCRALRDSRVRAVSLSGSTARPVSTVWTIGTAGLTGSGQGAGMVVGWG
ncbi:hypothetical protein SAV14893_042760 [Streptomyces avermitilis]|uniref:Uncharacterized protein n=1 Tax=Streptomyces avermitilis TaxID=33903 RepID=A0A4D4M0V9_STRAX|nr:hypothetical protein SAVMC3_54890 [Streptomyces avermitilis]GDY64883.1 hypothetical protein SAV14893_042760 [Streptomyces avermitilis]GDY74926.1 hypothetical protein SAV31267_044110 [Streptomyces avermitilis]GDY83950.1 hypothetical protein SAVCW2_31490 [Streptomyces avermitilis]